MMLTADCLLMPLMRTVSVRQRNYGTFIGTESGKEVRRKCKATARQGQAEILSKSRKKYLTTTYKPFR